MNIRAIPFLFFIFNFHLLFGQTHTLIPNTGIEGVPIVIDTSRIADVIAFYGADYVMEEYFFMTSYRYEKMGLTFQINPYDKNQIVRSIVVEAPFRAKTISGITLNESTMNDVLTLYNNKNYFIAGNSVYSFQNGVTFFMKIDSGGKGYNFNEKIYKIELNNDDEHGTFSKVNYEYNTQPIEDKLAELLSVLQSDSIDFNALDLFWEKEEKTKKTPYGLTKKTTLKREMENNLLQENMEISLAGTFYSLNIIKRNGKAIYLKFREKNNELFKRVEEQELEKLNLLHTDFDVFVYGTACGIDGIPPEKCREMLVFVKENDYKQLAEWVKSANPELAAYGYTGLDFLKRKGIKLLPTESKRMKELEKLEMQVSTCSNAFGTTEKMNKVLNKNNLKRDYRAFRQYGWF